MTIEERADAYVGHPEEIDEFSSATIKRYAFFAVLVKKAKKVLVHKRQLLVVFSRF